MSDQIPTHEQTIPARTIYWDHLRFGGRRIAQGHPGNRWGIIYAGFESRDDALLWPSTQPITPQVSFEARGPVVDHFFWDSEYLGGQFIQTEARVGAFLHWALTGNPTEYELFCVDNLEWARSQLAGVVLFNGAFTATLLPEQRTPEGDGILDAPEGWVAG